MLTRPDIIRLGQEAGLADEGAPSIKMVPLERFAALVEAETLKQFSSGIKVSIPTLTMEQEFHSHYRRGYAAAKFESLKARQQAIEAAGFKPEFDAIHGNQEELAMQFCMEIAGRKGEPGSNPDPVRLLEMAEALYLAEFTARTQPMRTPDAHKED